MSGAVIDGSGFMRLRNSKRTIERIVSFDLPLEALLLEVLQQVRRRQATIDLELRVQAAAGPRQHIGRRCRWPGCRPSTTPAQGCRAASWRSSRAPAPSTRRRTRSAVPAAGRRASISLGRISLRSTSNGSTSRKKIVSLVVIASTTLVCRGRPSGARARDEIGRGRDALATRERTEARLDQVFLAPARARSRLRRESACGRCRILPG
jgi:hypothetical protein